MIKFVLIIKKKFKSTVLSENVFDMCEKDPKERLEQGFELKDVQWQRQRVAQGLF